jgi:hypothetical protein
MKIWIAKRLIDRAVDDNKDIPAWITRLMERDENLRAYEASQRALVNRLRSDSSGWVLKSSIDASVAGGTPQVVKQPRFSAATIAALTTALCLLVAAALWFGQSEPDNGGTVAGDVPVEPLESEDVREGLGHDGQTFEEPSIGFEDYAAIVADNRPADLGRLTSNYVRQAGSVYGRGLAMLGGQ